jgi:hypothetical protein
VIRQGQHPHATRIRPLDKSGRGKYAIGGGAVAVQINMHE